MGEGIQGPPNEYDFGYDFNYAQWPIDTSVDLVNVPWNNDYRDVVKFENRAALDNYIDSLQGAGIRITKMSTLRMGEPVRINIPFNRALKYNYIRVSNPANPGDIQRNYYYFILDVKFISKDTTELTLQLDIWQTFIYDVTFGNCYVERGHIGIANENNFDNYGRDYLTVPEGIDVGADYRVITFRSREIMGISDDLGAKSDIIIVSTTDLLADPGTQQNPSMKTGPGSSIGSLPSGATFYVFKTFSEFSLWLTAMAPYPWITQGIVSVTAMPEISRYDQNFDYGSSPLPRRIVGLTTPPIHHNMLADWRNDESITSWIPSRYRHLKKFFTFPYMVIEVTTWSGTPIVLRPELWRDPNAKLQERPVYMPPNQRVQFIPRGYNSSGQQPHAYYNMSTEELIELAEELPFETEESRQNFIKRFGEAGDDFGDYLDIMTQMAGFPSLPVVNNMAINYLAANAHSIAYQRQSADWSQTRALNAASGQYDIASGAIQAMQDITGINTGAALAQTASQNELLRVQAMVSALGGIAGGATGGSFAGPAGAVIGGVGGAVSGIANGINAGFQTMRNDEATSIANAQAWDTNAVQSRQSTNVRDTNNDVARFAARGDYMNQIAGINAKVQDAAMIQPSISGQFGGDTANISHFTSEISVRWKLIDDANMRIIGDFWLRYGYAIRAFIRMPASLMVMSKFTYWKLTETYITAGGVPEMFKQGLRGIMEKGVTVYAHPSYIGTVDLADNQPLPGVGY